METGPPVTMGVPDSEPLVPDEVFEILSNHRRRMVLYYLRKQGDAATVKELAEEIAAMENDVAVEDVTSEQRKRVYVSLYQTHLPMMADLNVIEYDKDAGTVNLATQTTSIDRYLTSNTETTYPWTAHYAVLIFTGVALLALSALGAPFFESIPIFPLGIGVLLSVLVSAAVQYWVIRKRNSVIPPELMN